MTDTATVVLGSDHAGYDLKNHIVELLKSRGITPVDMGPESKESTDYPLYAQKVCDEVLKRDCLGILICGSGIGMSMAANRIPGIRAALCWNEYLARMTRMHNNANVLCLGERVLGIDLADSIVDAFLSAEFEGGRHQRRIDLFDK